MALTFTHVLDVRYRPYRLDPDTPLGGRDRKETILAKFPDPAVREADRTGLVAAMADVGLSFDPTTPTRIPNTVDAHRLMYWAQTSGLGREVLSALFEAYWIHGEDIGEHTVLAQIAEEIGLDGNEIRCRLETKEDRRVVEEEAAGFRSGGVSGVPTFIVNEQTGFAGALPKADLLDAFKQLSSETAAPSSD